MRWITSWMSGCGALTGPVVHRGDLKRLLVTHDTPWGHAVALLAMLRVWYRTQSRDALGFVQKMTLVQQRRITRKGSFRYCGHEDGRFSSLVHNAIADWALLHACDALEAAGRSAEASTVHETVQRNIQDYLLKCLYRRDDGLFVMNPVDYYAPGRGARYVLNMNAAAALVLTIVGRKTDDASYEAMARHIVDWILRQQSDLAVSLGGGFPYSNIQPQTAISIYSGLTALWLSEIYGLTRADKLKSGLQHALVHLDACFEPQSHLVRHGLFDGRWVRSPQFVSGGAIVLEAMHASCIHTGCDLPVRHWDRVRALLRRQYPNGAIANFQEYDSTGNGRRCDGKAPVWEDAMPTTGWNAHSFYFLARFSGSPWQLPSGIPTFAMRGPGFRLVETARWVFLVSASPTRSMAVLVFRKGWSAAVLALNAIPILRLLRSVIAMFRRRGGSIGTHRVTGARDLHRVGMRS